MINRSIRTRFRRFSMVEMLLVVALILILASMLLPALEEGIESAKRSMCMSNLKQLQAAHNAYTLDSNAWFPRPHTGGHARDWVHKGDNAAKVMAGTLWPYTNNLDVYYCPSDETHLFRSYSISDWFGGSDNRDNPGSRFNHKRATVRNQADKDPSEAFVTIEESDPRGLNLNSYYSNPGGTDTWTNADWPGGYHMNGYSLNFFDGHAKYVKFLDPLSIVASLQKSVDIPATNVDLIKLDKWQGAAE